MIVGLGNPGSRYEMTRHNCGFLAVDRLAEQFGAPCRSVKCGGLYSTFVRDGKTVLLVKPQKYMNLSGEVVRDLAQSFSVPVEHIVVLFDDASLPPGKLRVRRSGSDGGHNGIKNIIYHLQSNAFPRVKIGIGRGEGGDLADHVLADMDPEVYDAIKLAPEAALCILDKGADAAMAAYNGGAKA